MMVKRLSLAASSTISWAASAFSDARRSAAPSPRPAARLIFGLQAGPLLLGHGSELVPQ